MTTSKTGKVQWRRGLHVNVVEIKVVAKKEKEMKVDDGLAQYVEKELEGIRFNITLIEGTNKQTDKRTQMQYPLLWRG